MYWKGSFLQKLISKDKQKRRSYSTFYQKHISKFPGRHEAPRGIFGAPRARLLPSSGAYWQRLVAALARLRVSESILAPAEGPRGETQRASGGPRQDTALARHASGLLRRADLARR